MKQFYRLSTSLLFMVCVSMTFASDENKIFPYKYEMKDLPNGLRVIVVPTDYPNLVSIQIPVQTGSRNEVEPGRSGFAHFFEHMMFRGTEKYPADVYNNILKNAGADQNAYTTDDFTNYHITFSKEDLETVIKLEGDRFQNLKFSVEDFKTEARAVLGEYNKNYANPIQKLIEAQRNLAYQKHTYKHTTMGFIQDIENMPNMYDYSLTFFDRFYRPEYVTVILVGDVEPNNVFSLVEKYWGDWKRGNYKADIPTEPEPNGPLYEHIPWDAPTLPWLTVAFHGPAASETETDMAAMDLIADIGFSSSSPLYQKLVVKEQKLQALFAYFPDHKDPYLLTVGAMLKNPADAWYIRDEIQAEMARLRTELISEKRLKEIQSNKKYAFASGLDSSANIGGAFARFVSRNRDPETINKAYALYDKVSPKTLKDAANRYFTDKRMVVNTLSHGDLPEAEKPVGSVDAHLQSGNKTANIKTHLLKNQSPLINLRFLFEFGAANDPAGKEGLANLTASMITDAGSKSMTYREIQQAMYPLAAGFGNQVDKEMTVLGGSVHRDNLAVFYDVISDQILNPAWSEDDFSRVKTNIINGIKVSLRGNNDEELGKEVLYEMIYDGHPYGHVNLGHVEAVEKLTLDDVKAFYAEHFNRANLTLGLAGGFDDAFVNQIKKDMGALPEGKPSKVALSDPAEIKGLQVQIVEKETRATAISLGFPIDINRSHEDFAALWLIRSYFGEHRSTNSYLYQRIREIRGMNYGDYAYIEYFPRGMFQFHPDPNLGRRQQIFQIWIRPVPPEKGHFALRITKYELDKLVKEGISEEDFEATRNYLSKFVNVLTGSQDRQLGYALDSAWYGIGEFPQHIRDGLAKLTHKDVNRVLRKYLQSDNLKIAIITKDAKGLRDAIVAEAPSPISYDADKDKEILDEDKVIQNYKLGISADHITITNVEDIFR